MNGNPLFTVQSGQPDGPKSKVAIVTDSIAQVPVELAHQLGIYIVPFSLAVEGNIFTDLVDLDLNQLYQRMRLEKDLHLETSAPSVGKFYETFKACRDSGAESVLYVGISSHLSRSFTSAEEAAGILHEEIGALPVFLYDSHLATAAQGFLAIEAARMAIKGAAAPEILDYITAERKRTGFAAGLETLEYLARGGRIGKAAYMLGNAIHILPVISIDANGDVAPVRRVQGHHHLLNEILLYVKSKVSGYGSLSLTVMHADALIHAEKLQSMAVEQLHPDEINITTFTPTMVAHTGPGIIGLAYHWRP